MNIKYAIISSFSIALTSLVNISAYALADVKVQIVENPRENTSEMLEAVARDGTDPLRDFLTDFGYSNLQIEQTLSMVDSLLTKDEKPTVKIIEEIDNAGIMRQVYAYTHLGGNAWFFWRMDYVKTAEGWAFANFVFHSDYSQVMAAKFDNHIVLK